MPKCRYYPDKDDDCICEAGSDISGAECTSEDEKICQWARVIQTREVKDGDIR